MKFGLRPTVSGSNHDGASAVVDARSDVTTKGCGKKYQFSDEMVVASGTMGS